MRLLIEAYQRVTSWLRQEKGQTLIEYGLIAALISIVIVAAFATGLNGAFTNLVTGIANKLKVT